MQLSISSNHLKIEGNIKSVSDFQSIKQSIDKMILSNKTIIMDIKDSLSITSSVIGYLNKLVVKDGIGISMHIGDPSLIELLDDLNLKSTFQAIKV